MDTIKRIFDFPEYQKRHYPQKVALANKLANGEWKTYSTDEFIKNAKRISKALIQKGYQKGDKIANISYNRPEWNFLDMGLLMAGIHHVPLYPTLSEKELIYVLNDSGCKLIFAETGALADKIERIIDEIPSLEGVYTFTESEKHRYWKILITDWEDEDFTIVSESTKEITEDDVATLIYTSGTTGSPKGVMLTHKNLVSNVLACSSIMPIDKRHTVLSFLPLCHVFERMVVYLYIKTGVSIYYAESLETIAENLKEVRPHFFTTVPRLLEKVYDKIYAKGMALSGIKKALFFWALNLGLKYEHGGKNGWLYTRQLKLANKLIFSKWREALGNRIIGIVSGGAALQARLARVFWAAGLKVVEGYGLTETSPVIAVNQFNEEYCRFGSVGKPIKGVEVKIANDGEILTRGPHVMKGYFNKDEMTREVIDEDGFLHTGDIGIIDEEGFLRITDRKKEIFKTSGGKYIAPQPIENKLKESPFIEQVMVCGENKAFPSALISPAKQYIRDWCSDKGINITDDNAILQNQAVIDRIQTEIDKYNESLAQYEKIKRFVLINNEWSIDGGELTHTQKLKRKNILEKYADVYQSIYAEKESKYE